MAKLMIVVLQQLDAQNVVTALEEAGHRLTRIPSIGGFLDLENVTLLIAVQDELVSNVIEIITRYCSVRDIELPLVVRGRLKDQLPSVVRHGGATIMVANLESVQQV